MSRPNRDDNSNDSSSIWRGTGGQSRKYLRINPEPVRIPQVDHGNAFDVPPGFGNSKAMRIPQVDHGNASDVPPGFRKQNQRCRENGDGVLNPDVPPGFEKHNQCRHNNGDNILNSDVPPGFEKQNRRHCENGDGVLVPGIMVGQVLEGVIEAEFDGGYLVSIGCGELKGVAGGILRGVAFRRRRAQTSSNDGVAPDVQLRRMDETLTPLPFAYMNQNLRSKEGTRTGCKDTAANAVNQSTQTVSPFLPGTPSRFFVPVVLKPVNLPDSVSAPTHGRSSNGVTTSTQGDLRPANDGSTVNNQVPPVTPEMDDNTDCEQSFADDTVRAAEPVLSSHSQIIECPFGNFRTGEMTKLLLKVLQDSMEARQRAAAEQAGSHKRKFDERETTNGANDSENSLD